MIGTWQAIIILVIVVLLFGAKRIPDLAGSVGKGLKEFKNATKEDDDKEIAEKNSDSNDEGKNS
jgi:sec-independent protein translocase protein TatA